MTPAARYAAAIDVLDGFLAGEPAEKLLSNWARKNRYAGSKDRAAVRDIVFDCLRNIRSFGGASGINGGRGLAVGHCLAAKTDIGGIFSGVGYGPAPLSEDEHSAVALPKSLSLAEHGNVPDWIYEILVSDLGETAAQTASALSQRAPVDLRVNLTKTTVGGAGSILAKDDVVVEPLPTVATGLRVLENPRRVASSKAYQTGLVELQDAASQSVIGLLDIAPAMRVLDYCAGGGGKTLAMAGSNPQARFDAWDVSAARLDPIKNRAERAGAIVNLLSKRPTEPNYDLVLVDAPCSGSGSWRRNPEGKWRLSPERLDELVSLQSEVLQLAARCVTAYGVLAYATCSLFARENRLQVDKFLKQNQEFRLIEDHSFNVNSPGDGFYCAILQNNCSM